MGEPYESLKRMENILITSAENLRDQDREKFLDEVEEVEKSAWPSELQAPREKFTSRLNVFPRGFFVARVTGKIKGVTTSQLTTYDPEGYKSWNELTDNGMIVSSHDSNGNAVYVVSVAVSADAQGLGLGSKLLESQKDLARKLNKKYLFLGARIPGYDKYCKENGETSVDEYLKMKNEKSESVDPEIRFYERRGLKPVKVVKEFEPDEDSRDYGVVMLWENI